MKRAAIFLAALPLIGGCSAEEDTVPPVSAKEAKALDEAAEMIEQRRLPPDALATEESKAGAEPPAGEAEE